MKLPQYVLVAGAFLLLSSFSQPGGNNSFFTIVEKGGIIFSKPAVTKEVTVILNDELNYQYAFNDTVNNIEIRYLVYPLQEAEKHFNGPHADTGIERIDPNFIHTNLLLAYAYRVQGKEMNVDGTMPEIHEISHAAVQKEFNAEWGAYVDVQPCDEFAQKYKYCSILAIHKDNLADAFIIYLYDNKDAFLQKKPFEEETTDRDFRSLQFTKK